MLSSLQQDVLQLGSDLAALHRGSNVTAVEVQAVAADFATIAATATRPNPADVAALNAEVRVILANGPITPAESVVLKKDLAAVLVSANVPRSLATQTAAAIQTVVAASGVTRSDTATILGDIKAIAVDLGSSRK